MDRLTASAWFTPALSALIAVAVALIVQRIGRAVLRRLSGHRRLLGSVMTQIDGPAQWVLPLLALQFVWQGAADELAGIDGVRRWSGVLMIGALTWLAIATVRGAADGIALRNPYDAADNLHARRVLTQTRVMSRIVTSILLVAGISFMLMTFPSVRQLGASLLASAGVIGIVVGMAAKPVFGNLIAGLQIALAQPIRIDDVLIVKDEWGRVEEITGSYVVLKIWDERRLIIPLQWFIENPFQNWTRSSSQLLGTVMLYVDFTVDIGALRAEAQRPCAGSPDWDQRVCIIQVTDTNPAGMELRVLVSSPSAGQAFDLRCAVREGLLAHLLTHQPAALPRQRSEWVGAASADVTTAPSLQVIADAAKTGRSMPAAERAPAAA